MITKLETQSKTIAEIQSVFLMETGINFKGYKAGPKVTREFMQIFNSYIWFLNEYTNLTKHEIGIFVGYSQNSPTRPVQLVNTKIVKHNDSISIYKNIKNQHQIMIEKYEQIKSHKLSHSAI